MPILKSGQWVSCWTVDGENIMIIVGSEESFGKTDGVPQDSTWVVEGNACTYLEGKAAERGLTVEKMKTPSEFRIH
jgi:hypothetical protein